MSVSAVHDPQMTVSDYNYAMAPVQYTPSLPTPGLPTPGLPTPGLPTPGLTTASGLPTPASASVRAAFHRRRGSFHMQNHKTNI